MKSDEYLLGKTVLIWGQSKVYRQKFSFMVTHKQSRKTWFLTVYSTIYLPKWNVLNTIISSLSAILQFCLKLVRGKPYEATVVQRNVTLLMASAYFR